MCTRVGDMTGVDRRVHQPLPAHLEREGQPPVHDDAQVAFHLGVQLVADGVVDAGEDAVGLAVVVDVLDAAQHRIGAAHAHVGRPRAVRVLLVVAQVGQHARRATGRTGSGPAPAGCWWPRTAARPRRAPPPRRMPACPESSGTSARARRPPARRSRRCGRRRRGAARTPRRPTREVRCADRRGTADVVWARRS